MWKHGHTVHEREQKLLQSCYTVLYIVPYAGSMQSGVNRGAFQSNAPTLLTRHVRRKPSSAPTTIVRNTTAPNKALFDVTRGDIGKKATQKELDNFLSCYISTQLERVKYIAPENIMVRLDCLFDPHTRLDSSCHRDTVPLSDGCNGA